MRFVAIAPILAACAVAANSVTERAAEDAIRAGNVAAGRGDFAAAEAHYAAAAERTVDPGLVAFNRAAVSYRRGEWRDAEAGFTRALDDRACPPDRRAKAWYNRGVCLIRRGGLAELRVAIDCFESCLVSPVAGAALTADARHNLELAKVLWLEARAKEQKTPLPNDPPDFPPETDPTPPQQGPGGDDSGDQHQPQSPPEIDPRTGLPKDGATAQKTDRRTPGAGTLPVNVGGAALPPRTPEEVRNYLKGVADRLAKERRSVAELVAPPERPRVKDW